MCLRLDLGDLGKTRIDAYGLRYLLYIPNIRTNRGRLTAFVERSHSNHDTFHFPTSEISVILEDLYMILCIPINSELVNYDYHEMGGTTTLCQIFNDESILGAEV